jgi:DNA adenine methylase
MKKPFARVGGKSLLVDDLEKLLPKNYESYNYVEPFAGGASLYFYKKPSNKYEILNDLDKNIYTLLKGFKTYKIEKINNSFTKLPRTKAFFDKLKEATPKDNYSKFIRLLYLIKNSFFGQMGSFNSGRNYSQHAELPDYHERMKNTKVYNNSYDKIIKKYDTPDTIFYLDPPYEKSKGLYENPFIDYDKLADIIKNIKGKVLLSINYNKEFIKLFNFMKYKILKTRYADPLKGVQSREVKELVFYNY